MPVSATFDRGELFRLLRGTPGLPDYEVALALTKHNVMRGRNLAVTANTVKKARQRYRVELEAVGVHRRNGESVLVSELKSRTGHRTLPAEQCTNSRILKYLRFVSRLEAGKSIPANERGWLESWLDSMRSRKYVVDVTPDGVPYTRPAGPGELTPEGDLFPGGVGLLAAKN